MLVLAIGLMGLATLQTYSLRTNLSAYTRGQATQLLYDMSDRMRANKTAAASYVITDSNTLDSGTVNTACTTTNAPASCTPDILANNDLIEWNKAIRTTLPKGKGIIAIANGNYRISVTWDDNRDGKVDNDDPTLSMSLQL